VENAYEKLFRHLQSKGSVPEGSFAVADIGATKTNVIIYKNSNFFVNRIITSGTGALFDQLQEKLSADKKELEKLLNSRGILSQEEKNDAAGQIITKYLDIISAHITKLIDFYQSRNVQDPIGAVYLTGGLSKLAGVSEYLSLQLNLPVNALSKLTGFLHKNPKSQSDPVDYSGAIGATMREVNKK
jgi:type IV pilus assembly protein PilM